MGAVRRPGTETHPRGAERRYQALRILAGITDRAGGGVEFLTGDLATRAAPQRGALQFGGRASGSSFADDGHFRPS